MNQRCPHKIDCEGSDSPIANLTSETPEGQYWRAIDYCCNGAIKQYFSNLSYDDAIDGVQRLLVTSCPSCPPDTGDDSYTCDALCADGSASVTASSTLSQDDACFKAQELANQLPCPPVAPPPSYHCNDTQICDHINEDGTYTYIVLPCSVYGSSTEIANSLAMSRACERAKENRIRLGPIVQCCCADSVYASSIRVISDESVLTFAIISGSLPPGLAMAGGTTTSKSILISGTPTTAGNYAFSVRAYDTSGNYATRQYTISVIEITTTSLPDFSVGTAYSAQLSATGGSGDYVWGIRTGTLPEGLTLNPATGLISGTPTEAVDSTLTFEVVDRTCEAYEALLFAPTVRMTTVGTTRLRAMRGYPEYQNSTGAFYKKITWSGQVVQTATTIDGRFCAGARFVYSGYDEIDASGNLISRHRKDLFSACPKPIYPPIAEGPNAAVEVRAIPLYLATSVSRIHDLIGYCWAQDPNTCPSCSSVATAWPLQENRGVSSQYDNPNGLLTDPNGFAKTPTSYVYAGSATGHFAITNVNNFPGMTPGIGLVTQYSWVNLVSNGGFVAELSEPYTEADAIASEQVITNTLECSENLPNYTTINANQFLRATYSRYTSVDFTLRCSGLMVGKNYVVSYDLYDTELELETTETSYFTATGTTHNVTGTLPTPSAGNKIFIQNPHIAFA